jgi:hypothetical protein
MVAAACAADAGLAAGGVDILSGTLLSCDIPCNADSLVSLSKYGGGKCEAGALN